MTDFEGDYEGKWWNVKQRVEGINRTDEDWWELATARVHLVVSDQSVRKIGVNAFRGCSNLVKVTAPFFEEVGSVLCGGCTISAM